MNTKKILGIIVCMLVMTMIPVAAGATTDINKTPETSPVGWTFIQGIITQPFDTNNGMDMAFHPIWIHYSTKGSGDHHSGMIHNMLETIVIPGDFHGIIGNHFIIAFFWASIF